MSRLRRSKVTDGVRGGTPAPDQQQDIFTGFKHLYGGMEVFQKNRTGIDMCDWRLAALDVTLGCLTKTGVVGGNNG